jgi:CRP-like cAMP-binding protein
VGVCNTTTSSLDNPWLSIFAEASRFELPRESDLYAPDEPSDRIFVIEHGAVVEIRTDHVGTSHVVGLSGRGSLLGSRLAATHIRSPSVRAITLIDSTLREMQRTDFLRATLGDPDLARAYMRQLARRLEVARHLSEVCSSPSAGGHIVGLLHTVADVFGAESNGSSSISIPSTLLERMTGTPQRIIEVTLKELRSHGIVELERDAIRWVM